MVVPSVSGATFCFRDSNQSVWIGWSLTRAKILAIPNLNTDPQRVGWHRFQGVFSSFGLYRHRPFSDTALIDILTAALAIATKALLSPRFLPLSDVCLPGSPLCDGVARFPLGQAGGTQANATADRQTLFCFVPRVVGTLGSLRWCLARFRDCGYQTSGCQTWLQNTPEPNIILGL